MKHKISHKLLSAVLVLLVTLIPLSVSAGLAAPDWVTTVTNPDSSVSVVITSPPHMIDDINHYEYSTDGFKTYKILSDTAGGEFLFSESCEFSLRYYYKGICSAVFTLPVVISRHTVVECPSTGISVVIPDGSSIPTDITVTAFELINGADYTAAGAALPKNSVFRMFSVNVLKNGKAFSTDEAFSYLFPTDTFSAEKCSLYFMGVDNKPVRLTSTVQDNMLSVSTPEAGIFIIAVTNEYKKGDINNDGKVQASDARYALRISAQLEKSTPEQVSAGDINKNGKIDASDARKILRFAASLDII